MNLFQVFMNLGIERDCSISFPHAQAFAFAFRLRGGRFLPGGSNAIKKGYLYSHQEVMRAEGFHTVVPTRSKKDRPKNTPNSYVRYVRLNLSSYLPI
jgi:hypothetical protein